MRVPSSSKRTSQQESASHAAGDEGAAAAAAEEDRKADFDSRTATVPAHLRRSQTCGAPVPLRMLLSG